MNIDDLISSLSSKFSVEKREDTTPDGFSVKLADLHQLLATLKAEHHFDMLLSHTAIDWLGTEEADTAEFEATYLIFCTERNQRIFVTTRLPRESATLPSASDLWSTAQWQEREVYDLFGIKYSNHPDLRRIFLDDDWDGFPLRKDYQDDFMLERPK